MSFQVLSRIYHVLLAESNPTSTALHFLPQFIILILALKMYLVLMHDTARDNGHPAEEMAFAIFSIESYI